MAISRSASQRPYLRIDYIELEVEPVEQVSDFMYLGATISGDGTIDRDLDIRIQRANAMELFINSGRYGTAKLTRPPPISGIQGCCYYYLIVWSRGLEHNQETNKTV